MYLHIVLNNSLFIVNDILFSTEGIESYRPVSLLIYS